MSQKELPMETGVPVKLTADERERKMRSLLGSMRRIDEYNADIEKHRAAKKALIKAEEETIGELRRVLEADEQLVRQGDLFVDQHSATRGLAQVAEAAGDVDTLIAEQTALMDATDAARDDGVPVIDAMPEACPLCGEPVRAFGDNGATCTVTTCVWVGRIVPPEEQPPADAAEVCNAWCNSRGTPEEAVAIEAATWWSKMHHSAAFGPAMVSWRAATGAPFAVTWVLRETIAAVREHLRVNEPAPATDVQPEQAAPMDCDHSAIPAGRKPGKGRKLVCPTCRATLTNCEACDKRVTVDDVGDCQYDACGKKLCAACQEEHEHAAEAALAAVDVDAEANA
jgi:hypothetical protein